MVLARPWPRQCQSMRGSTVVRGRSGRRPANSAGHEHTRFNLAACWQESTSCRTLQIVAAHTDNRWSSIGAWIAAGVSGHAEAPRMPAQPLFRMPATSPRNSGSIPALPHSRLPMEEGSHPIPYFSAYAAARRAFQRGRTIAGSMLMAHGIRQGHVRLFLLSKHARTDTSEPLF
jgi:hypothetical protein